MSTPRGRTQAGVTLIEVLIAVTLLSLLSVAMVISLRVGLSAYSKTNTKLMENRKVAGAQRILESELEGLVPVVSPCGVGPNTAGKIAFFQGEPQTMRLVSTFSLQQAWRGPAQILEFFVIPGEAGRGVRLVVNEIPYAGPKSAGALCLGVAPDPLTGGQAAQFAPVQAGQGSFVLADLLAYCRFSYLSPAPKPELPPLWRPNWAPVAKGWPLGVRIEMAPLEPDPSRVQPITVTAPLHLHRSPEIEYGDY